MYVFSINTTFFLTVDQNNFGKKIPVFQVIFLCQEKQSLTACREQSAVSNSFLFQCSRLLADLKRLSEFKDTKDKVDPYPLF